MNITAEQTVAETVTQNIKAAHVFKKHGIDFCCGGAITIAKACDKKKVDYDEIMKELEVIGAEVERQHNYDSWSLDFLIDHIINIHHSYVLESIPVILQYAAKVAKVHGHHYSQVIWINELFIEVANELSSHMQKEENVLFPYVKQLVEAKSQGTDLSPIHFGTVKNPITMMEQEHEAAGDIFKEIAILTDGYTTPPEACNTFKALYAKLEEFEQDLHQHIHLENNILFPKAIKLEQSF